jgi:hypothetical protein
MREETSFWRAVAPQRDFIRPMTISVASLLLDSTRGIARFPGHGRAGTILHKHSMKGCATTREGSLKRWQKGGAEYLLVVFALFFCVPALFGQESYREFEQGLNLSDSQRAQVEGIKKRYMAEWMALKNESAQKRLELWELRREQPYQRERLEKAQRDLDQLDAAKFRLFRRYAGEVSAVFNEEQRGRFNRFMDHENRRPMNQPRYRFHER